MNKVLLEAISWTDGWQGASGKLSVHWAHRAVVSGKPVNFDVLRQVVAACKLLLTHWALVRLHSGVGAPVPGKLVWSGKPPSATRPSTCKGLFSCMPSQVGFQMAAFGVHLGTSRESTFVHFNEFCRRVLLKFLTHDDPSLSLDRTTWPDRFGSYWNWGYADKFGRWVQVRRLNNLWHQCKCLPLDVDQELCNFNVFLHWSWRTRARIWCLFNLYWLDLKHDWDPSIKRHSSIWCMAIFRCAACLFAFTVFETNAGHHVVLLLYGSHSKLATRSHVFGLTFRSFLEVCLHVFFQKLLNLLKGGLKWSRVIHLHREFRHPKMLLLHNRLKSPFVPPRSMAVSQRRLGQQVVQDTFLTLGTWWAPIAWAKNLGVRAGTRAETGRIAVIFGQGRRQHLVWPPNCRHVPKISNRRSHGWKRFVRRKQVIHHSWISPLWGSHQHVSTEPKSELFCQHPEKGWGEEGGEDPPKFSITKWSQQAVDLLDKEKKNQGFKKWGWKKIIKPPPNFPPGWWWCCKWGVLENSLDANRVPLCKQHQG